MPPLAISLFVLDSDSPIRAATSRTSITRTGSPCAWARTWGHHFRDGVFDRFLNDLLYDRPQCIDKSGVRIVFVAVSFHAVIISGFQVGPQIAQ